LTSSQIGKRDPSSRIFSSVRHYRKHEASKK
jgi:hypothetical protein